MSSSHLLSRALCQKHIITLFVLLFALSACASEGAATGFPSPQASRGPIQFYDEHGALICEIHGHNPQTDCLTQTAPVRQFAANFIDYAVIELANDLHVQATDLPSSALRISMLLPSSALKVSTTLDLALQKQILQNTRQYIATMANVHSMTNAAEVMIDYHNGAIRSLIGSLDNQVNIATQSVRQPGSAFKPFVYATAFEQGISPGEVVYDAPISVGQGSQTYTPSNVGRTFHGYMSYRSALQNDYNIPAFKLYLKTGFEALRKNMVAMGIQPGDIGTSGLYATPFGIRPIPLLDMTAAYGTIADGGLHVPPHAIEKVSTGDNHDLYTARPQGTRALSPQTAFMLTDVLSDNAARANEFGLCSPLLLYTTTQEQCNANNPGTVRPAAAHSGITDAFKDTTTIGYTTDLVVGTWAGNSNDAPMVNIIGMDGAARIWHDTMLLAEANRPITPFPGAPAGVRKKTVNYPNLTTTDWYKEQ